MNFNIRNAKTEDIENIREVIGSSARTLQIQYYKNSEIEAALELVNGIESLIDSGTYFLAEYGNVIAGCGGVTVNSAETKRAEIRGFFVAPKFSRKGIASQILAYCESHCLKMGIESLFLTSTLSGEPFYKNYGFIETERFDQALSNGQFFKLVKMEKLI
ncbi:MAG: GNAT family N-acetyltransferase [Pseudomonadota bacterium]